MVLAAKIVLMLFVAGAVFMWGRRIINDPGTYEERENEGDDDGSGD